MRPRLGGDGDGDLLEVAAANGTIGWNALAVGETGVSRRLVEVVPLFDLAGMVKMVVVDEGDGVERASKAWILDWRDAEGMTGDDKVPGQCP